MKRIVDQLVLLFYCFTVLLVVTANIAFVASFLIAVIYTSVNYFLNSRRFCLTSTCIYIAFSLFMPSMLLFFPVILYNIIKFHIYIILPIPLILVLRYGSLETYFLYPILLLGCLLSFALQYQSSAYEQLDMKYRKTRDDSTELTLLLKEKNLSLTEKQDYQIYTATLKERNRIAREIHDNVGHMLTRSILLVGALKMTNNDDQSSESLIQLEDTLNTAMTNVRESVHDLHDHSIDLKNVLDGISDTFTYCPIHMYYDMGYNVPREIKYSFITIVKEALNNVIKHSNASEVRITAREHPGLYQLTVDDNGTNGASHTSSSGLGIINIEDRVRSLGGTLQIRRENGFRIFITIPKKGENHEYSDCRR